MADTAYKLYKNCNLVGTMTRTDPYLDNRQGLTLGTANFGTTLAGLPNLAPFKFMEGTISFFRMWHGVELSIGVIKDHEPCDPGMFHNAGECEVCPAGHYSTQLGLTCIPCPAGTSNDDEGTSKSQHAYLASCTSCATGRFAPAASLGEISAREGTFGCSHMCAARVLLPAAPPFVHSCV